MSFLDLKGLTLTGEGFEALQVGDGKEPDRSS